MKLIKKIHTALFLTGILFFGSYLYADTFQKSVSYGGEDILTINLLNTGFSPNGDGIADELVFNFNFVTDKVKIKNWRIEIINLQTNEVIETFTSGMGIPKILKWDGVQKDKGIVEGVYKYVFTAVINDRNIYKEQSDIILDITPPYLSLKSSANMVSLKDNQFTKNIVFIISVGDESAIDINKSKLGIENSRGEVIKEWFFSSTKYIPQRIVWDGKDSKNKQVPPGEYKAVLSVFDIVDNKGTASQDITVFDKLPSEDLSEIKIEKDPRGLAINLYSDIWFDTEGSKFKKNVQKSLKRIIRLLKEYPENRVLIEGYSNFAESDNKNMEKSRQRAKDVFYYFVKEGILADRMQFVGYGEDTSLNSNMVYQGRSLNRIISVVMPSQHMNRKKSSYKN
ncbi:MAG: OmpA family protein [Endomicrobiaceae bacterium]